ncbi:MAG: hypothetical protein AAF515_12890 [Pseudomonadota bacterium]
MLSFLAFVAICIGVYLVWQISENLTELTFRIGEIQRDIGELRRLNEGED